MVVVGAWQPARVVTARRVTVNASVLHVDVPTWPGSEAGQHVDIRLTAEDGYRAERTYSIGSYGPGRTIELAVDEVPNGEVSPYLVNDIRAGDDLEVKGPLGGYFVWRPSLPGRVQLIGGGSGIVPLMAIARAAADAEQTSDFRLLYSARTPDRAIYRDELSQGSRVGQVDVTWAYTREAPEGWTGRIGRLDEDTIRAAVWTPSDEPTVYVCGPTGFVEHVADAMVELGHPPERVKTERFGGA